MERHRAGAGNSRDGRRRGCMLLCWVVRESLSAKKTSKLGERIF